MVKVQCIKCNREGSLTKKQTKSKGITYQYWYVEHHIGDKIKWCYLGKYEKLSDDYKSLIHKDTQTDTQNISKSEKSKFSSSNQTKHDSMWAGSSAWHERLTCTQEDAGSNPARSTTTEHEPEDIQPSLARVQESQHN